MFEDHLPFYRALALACCGPVLELGCGTGRVARAMAAAGVQVTGLDLSAPMIREAQRLNVHKRLDFVLDDMARFELKRRFALVVIPFRGFHELLTQGEQQACLFCAFAHLVPGGCLALDLFDPRPEIIARPFDPEIVDLPPLSLGRATLQVSVGERRADAVRQVMSEHWTFREVAPDGRILSQEEETHTLRWVQAQEMEEMLTNAGFTQLRLTADFSGSPYRPGREQVWVAQIPSGSI
ncbi:MAG: class I SAM-dependent methyltransferase [Holophaga sp.]|nr:class I SAM-dependent methyltransferase [Holophaga sp.]